MVLFRPDHPQGGKNPWFSALGRRRVSPTYSWWEFSCAISLFHRACVYQLLLYSPSCSVLAYTHGDISSIPWRVTRTLTQYQVKNPRSWSSTDCCEAFTVILWDVSLVVLLYMIWKWRRFLDQRSSHSTTRDVELLLWTWIMLRGTGKKLCSINNNRVSTSQRKISYPTIF